MKKIIFFTFLLISFSNSASVVNNYCIQDNYYFENGRFYYMNATASSYLSTTTIVLKNSIHNNYVSIGSRCYLDSTSTSLNISYSDYNFLMALSGILLGFSIVFLFSLYFTRRS